MERGGGGGPTDLNMSQNTGKVGAKLLWELGFQLLGTWFLKLPLLHTLQRITSELLLPN